MGHTEGKWGQGRQEGIELEFEGGVCVEVGFSAGISLILDLHEQVHRKGQTPCLINAFKRTGNPKEIRGSHLYLRTSK